MRLSAFVPTLVLCSIIGSGVAKAFDCTGVTLPSSIIICSDSEPMRLRDQQAELALRDDAL
jgi:hypothetical protein